MPVSLHIHNARIWTGDVERPRASSLTVREGWIDSLDAEAQGGPSIDAGGRLVIPGLCDAHTHLLMGGLSLRDLDLSGVNSRAEFEAAIATRHAQLPPEQWLIAGGWSEENWPGHQPPDKSWLQVAGDRPVVCRRMDIHALLVNDAVLRLIDTTTDPSGGRIARDFKGQPTGLMIEAAAWELVNPLLPKLEVRHKQEALRAAMKHYNAHGVTTVMSMEDGLDVRDVFAPIRGELTLRVSITLMDRGWPMEFSFGRDFDNDERLKVIGYKAFADGTLGSRTARMLQDYADDPGNRGMLVEVAKDGTLRDWARGVVAAGLSPSVHAIGDEAARIVLDALEGIEPRSLVRIEHAQQLHRDDVARFKGAFASMQPLHKADDARYVTQRLGAARLDGFFAFRGLHDAGAILAFGSDWPVVPVDPLLGIRTACSGLTLDGEVFTPEHNLTIEEALHAYTDQASAAAGFPNTGSLQVGRAGDLVMLDTEAMPDEWDPRDPGGTVLLTVLNGQVVYDAR